MMTARPTRQQVKEALAELREGQKKAAIYSVPFLVTIQKAARAWLDLTSDEDA